MSDRTPPARPAAGSARRLFATPESRIVLVAACVITILGILIGGYLYGAYLSARDLGGRDVTIEELRSENQKQKRRIDEFSAQLTSLQAKLAGVQGALDAIMPQANTYNISANQSLIVGDGRLTIGLVGSPANESITLDINGRPQVASAGQVIAVAPDPATNCQVQVQSFDMFKAVVTATCAGAKAK
ncbi:MAG TPA: hypothetical protein VEK75_06080 [Xanthobacteraceae bacterium]|nr:hypothetical protein [Xanthobacteraceae bacterium]